MRTTTEAIAELLAELERGVDFPARVRLFCDQRLAAALPPQAAARREWPGAEGGMALAAAAGAAWAEMQRGGRVLVVAPRSATAQGLWWEAAELCAQLGLGALTVLLVDGRAQDGARMAAFGWACPAAAPPPGNAPQLLVIPEQTAPLPSPSAPGAGSLRGDWPPVRLASLPAGGLPPWPWMAGAPAQENDGALRWLASREARLLIAHHAPPWRQAPATAATLFALAQLAGEGLRVCWRLPAGALPGWVAVLAEIGRRGFALKLLVAAAALPAVVQLGALRGWWVIAPADAREGAAVLAQALDSEDAVLIAEGEAAAAADAGVMPWLASEPYLPGSGRQLATGRDLTLVCESRSADLALAARARLAERGVEAGVMHCTSLLPLPRAQLEERALHAALVVVGGGALEDGLAAAVRATLPGAAVVVALGAQVDPASDVETIVRAGLQACRPPSAG